MISARYLLKSERTRDVSTMYGGSLTLAGGYTEASPLFHGLCGSLEQANRQNGLPPLAVSANSRSIYFMSGFFPPPKFSNGNTSGGLMCVLPVCVTRYPSGRR